MTFPEGFGYSSPMRVRIFEVTDAGITSSSKPDDLHELQMSSGPPVDLIDRKILLIVKRDPVNSAH
jgi:hypothetical protein